jgi:hypothetical protein
MGKPNRNVHLAGRYLRAAAVAAVWIDADGHVGAQDVAKFEAEAGNAVCPRGAHFILAYRLQLWMQDLPERPDQAAVAAKLEELAVTGGVGLTPHAIAVQSAIDAVERVDREFGAMQDMGDLREFNAAFKAARLSNPSIRFAEYLEAARSRCLMLWSAYKRLGRGALLCPPTVMERDDLIGLCLNAIVETGMPLFHFNSRTGDVVLPDPEGEELPTLAAAREVALATAREALLEALKIGDVPPDLIQVTDSEGNEVAIVPLTEVVLQAARKDR